MGWQVGKKWLIFKYTCIISFCMGMVSLIWTKVSRSCQLFLVLWANSTSRIFCVMPIILSPVTIIHSAALSIYCLIDIIFSPIASLYSFIHCALLWISCLWCIFQPLPIVMLKLFPYPYYFTCHSYNLVSHCFCDPHYFFSYPYIPTQMSLLFSLWCHEFFVLS